MRNKFARLAQMATLLSVEVRRESKMCKCNLESSSALSHCRKLSVRMLTGASGEVTQLTMRARSARLTQMATLLSVEVGQTQIHRDTP